MSQICAACGDAQTPAGSISGLCRECEVELNPTSEDDEFVENDAYIPTSVMLTTETAGNFNVLRRYGIVSARAVIGQNIFKDIAAGFRDFFGGRSKVMQEGFRNAETEVLKELEANAAERGANAIIGLDVQYSSVSGAGTGNMLLITAVGTAVKLRN